MSADTLLLADNLCYRRRRHTLLHGVSLYLRPGERLGLLGLNGAGKSTLLHILAGILRPRAGEVRLQGMPIQQATARARIGLVTDQPALPTDMTVLAWLRFCARMQGLKHAQARQAAEEQLHAFALAPQAHCLPQQLSRGQQQRLSLARALLHRPALLLLDEPGNGLDPLQAATLRRLLRDNLGQAGLILASHLPEDLALCHRVLLLADGRIRAELSAEQLQQRPLRHWLEAGSC